MKEVEIVMIKMPVYAIDEKCEHCPNLAFENLGDVLKCKHVHICWKALEMREGEKNE